jgi:hypothetical protein
MTMPLVAGRTSSARLDLGAAIALALFVALLAAELALFAWAAPGIDPTAPIFTT